MKRMMILFLIFVLVVVAEGEVTLSVYESDGVTPFDDRDIMVGTRLTLIVSSDSGGYWNGGLFVTGQDRAAAELSLRGWDPNTGDWAGSRYDDAGEDAMVWDYYDSWMWGTDLYTDCDDDNVVAGDWFVVDYEAIGVGDPNVGFYDYNISWDDPSSIVTFSHVPTRNFNDDEVVDLADYAVLASYWLADDCDDPNWCEGTDLNTDGDIDIDDLSLFAEFWLWGASQSQQMMGGGGGLPMGATGMQESTQSEPLPVQEVDIDAYIQWMEELWLQDESLGARISEDEWEKLIEMLRNLKSVIIQ